MIHYGKLLDVGFFYGLTAEEVNAGWFLLCSLIPFIVLCVLEDFFPLNCQSQATNLSIGFFFLFTCL